MQKSTKIIISVILAVAILSAMVITTFADASWTGEHGTTIYIPDVVNDVLWESEEGFAGGTLTDGTTITFGDYFTELALFQPSNSTKVLQYNNGSELTDPNFWQYNIPIKQSGVYYFQYEFEIYDTDIWDNYILFNDLSMYCMQSASNKVNVAGINDTLIRASGLLGYNFRFISTESENGYRIKVRHKFDFDNKHLTTTLYDVNMKEYEIVNDISQFNYNAATLNIRYQFTSGNFRSTDTLIYCRDISYYTVAKEYDQATIDAIIEQLQKFENDAYLSGAGNYASANEILRQENADLIASNEALYLENFTLLQDKDALTNTVSILENTINDKDNTIERLDGELNTMTDKYNSAKEGMQNAESVGGFFNGIAGAFEKICDILFEVEVYGITVGTFVGIVLVAAVVIFIIKILI